MQVKFLYVGMTWFSGGLGAVTCKFVNFSGVLSIAATIITLVFISLDRYFAILHPFVHIPVIRNTKLVTAVIWISSSLYFSLYFVLFDSVPAEDGRWVCRMVWSYLSDDRNTRFQIARAYFMTTFVVLYLIPLVAIAGLYIPIGRRLWSRKIPGETTAHQKRQSQVSKRKVLRMLIIVVVTFALCWLPTHIMHFLVYFFTDTYKKLVAVGHVESSFFFLSHANSAINPCLYIFLNQRFNHEFKNILRFIFCRPLKDDVTTAHSVYQPNTASEGAMLMRTHSSSSWFFKTNLVKIICDYSCKERYASLKDLHAIELPLSGACPPLKGVHLWQMWTRNRELFVFKSCRRLRSRLIKRPTLVGEADKGPTYGWQQPTWFRDCGECHVITVSPPMNQVFAPGYASRSSVKGFFTWHDIQQFASLENLFFRTPAPQNSD